MHSKNIVIAGKEPGEAGKAVIMLHGRGADAQDILSLSAHLNVKDYALFAPQATGHSWYPHSFMVPPDKNQPWLSSAISLLNEIVSDINNARITTENIYFVGFSQGACLTLEFVSRNATRYGGVAAFTGGLIGDKIYRQHYKGDFANTPFFIGTSDPDPHVPVERVNATAGILKEMNAAVTRKVYNNMGHTINADEISSANSLIFNT